MVAASRLILVNGLSVPFGMIAEEAQTYHRDPRFALMASEFPPSRPVRVLFVCLGNICRSPLAEGLFQDKVNASGLEADVIVDSAGTGGWHVGAPADRRMTATAAEHGTDLSKLKARQLVRHDLDAFDHVFVMDKSNLHDTLALDPDGDHGTRVRLFREFDPEPGDYQVPDPYYGGDAGFEAVYAIADRTTSAILERLAGVYGWDLEAAD